MSMLGSVSRSEFAYSAVGVAGTALLRALHLGTETRIDGGESLDRRQVPDQPVCLVSWHEQLLLLSYAHRDRGVAVLASDHRDGEYIARVLDRLGFVPVRGSSTRGGRKGLRGLARAAATGRDLAITPDGPRGPARVFRPEALAPALLAGVPILAVAAGMYPERRIETSWDRLWIPCPRSRIRIVYGDPRTLVRPLDAAEAAEVATELQGELNRLSELATRGAKADWEEAQGIRRTESAES
jgi:lysophospholipid acyltransferase (LPLAT)-like uncharacterized protein